VNTGEAFLPVPEGGPTRIGVAFPQCVAALHPPCTIADLWVAQREAAKVRKDLEEALVDLGL
jgi:hypothetical protein